MKELLIIIGLSTVLIVVIVLFTTGVFKKKHNKGSETIKSINSDDVYKKHEIPAYILPHEFKVGLIKQDPPVFMNNCNPSVLYPINGLEPDYGWKMPKDCRCTEFIQPP